MRSICLRLRRGDDLLLSIRQLAQREGLRCAAPAAAPWRWR